VEADEWTCSITVRKEDTYLGLGGELIRRAFSKAMKEFVEALISAVSSIVWLASERPLTSARRFWSGADEFGCVNAPSMDIV
jgi:hypothetical protein